MNTKFIFIVLLFLSAANFSTYAAEIAGIWANYPSKVVMGGGLGEYAVIAKRKKDKWFIGAMTNWESRTVKLDFSFLPDNKTYTAEICPDAKDADENAEHYVYKTIRVTKTSKIELPLAKGGSAVAYLHQ